MPFDTKKLDTFPTLPGTYLMKGKEGEVLYVGKAKNLRQRVKQYFIPGRDGRLMIPYLIVQVETIDTVVVSSEKEALLLENTLIKKYQPKYNALLKDDKTYTAIKVTTKDEWPTVKIVRYRGSPTPDGLYFGPYASAESARQTLDLLHKLFPLRQCSDQELKRRTRPCILYQIKRCIAPCVNFCSSEEYKSHVRRTIKFLKGEDKEVVKELKEELDRCSASLEFEKAAEIYKKIQHIEKTMEAQHVDRPLGIDADVIGLYREGDELLLVQMLFRGGKLIGSNPYDFEKIAEEDGELYSSFILQHYQDEKEIPPELLIPEKLADSLPLEEILSERRGKKVSLHSPQKGEKKVLLEMAQSNAKALFKSQKDQQKLREKTLMEMEERLHLSRYPYRIECFDNSHSAGSEAVSSMVVFSDALPDRKRYRTYRSKEVKKGDDYGAMREVLMRRYKRGKEEGDLPDLLIVDGGKGQLGVAIEVLNALNLTAIDIIALAKEEGRHDKGMSGEQIFLRERKEPIHLSKKSPILFLLQKIRDEAHRVAITFHKKRRSKDLIKSLLDDVPGIGPAKRKALLSNFGDVKKIAAASDEELKVLKGISQSNILSLRSYFKERGLT